MANGDQPLLDNIEMVLQEFPDCRILPEEEANVLVSRVAEKYNIDLRAIFPWEMPGARALYPYDIPSSWELMLSSLLDIYAEVIYLVVTDEGPYPWQVIALPPEELIPLLLELPSFEYFVFDDAMERVVFDTHRSELVVFEK